MRARAEIELQIRQMQEMQQRRLEEIATADPIWQKIQGGMEALLSTIEEDSEGGHSTGAAGKEEKNVPTKKN